MNLRTNDLKYTACETRFCNIGKTENNSFQLRSWQLETKGFSEQVNHYFVHHHFGKVGYDHR